MAQRRSDSTEKMRREVEKQRQQKMAQKNQGSDEEMEDFNMMEGMDGMDGIMLPGKNGKQMPSFGFYSDFDDVLRNDCLE